MTVRKGDFIELDIQKMAYGGRGVGRAEGLVIFVGGAVPGDRAGVRVFRKKKAYAEARLETLISPSPHRVAAPCPYSGTCGGCQWQHVAYEAQLGYKKAQVVESLEKIGGLKGIQVHDVLSSQEQFGYRNKMEFSFSDRRWFLPHEMDLKASEGGFALGLHVPGTYYKIIDVDRCLLQAEEGNRILRAVKAFARESGIPAYGLRSHEGFWRFLTLRYATAFDQWMVNLVTAEDRPEVLHPLVERLHNNAERIRTVVNNITRRRAAVAVGEQERVLLGEGWLTERIGPHTFRISANSFFQTNTRAALTLYRTVADFAGLTGRETVLDLYSGTGTIPVFLSDRAERVTGIEISKGAVEDARRNCRENGIDNCRFILGDLRHTLSLISDRPDVLIIDPPRTGMHKDVLSQVQALSPPRIVYVSCNPATLARDLARMNSDYEVIQVQPVDMFPHTYHIEAVVKLQARRAGGRPPGSATP